jgi:hypothetical protein
MKKLMIIALALIFMVPALSVFAGTVDIGGSYRVTWTKYDPGLNDTGLDDRDYFQQRIRLPITWNANDNVSFFIRMDWSEEGFGVAPNLTSVDYAYATIKHDTYQLRIGMQERPWGNSMMYDPDLYGFSLELYPNSNMTIALDYGKQDENGAFTDNTATGTNDLDLVGLKFEYKSDMFTVGAMFAQQDGTDGVLNKDDTKRGYGAYVTVPVGDAITINSELNVFSGDDGIAGGQDYEGTQFIFDLGFKMSDMLSFGATAVYAKGNDDATDTQITTVNDGGGSFASPIDFGGALAYDEGFGFGIMQAGGTFEPAADSGIIGAAFRVTAKVAEPVTIYAKTGWLMTEEDEVNGAGQDLEDLLFLTVSVDYAWQPNVTLSLGAMYINYDFNDEVAGYDDENRTALVARLGINF